MGTLDGVVDTVYDTGGSIRTGIQSANISTLLFAVTGVPAALAGLVWGYDTLGMDSMGGATANTLFQGATGVAGFLTLAAVSSKLDGRDDIHAFEIAPAVLSVGVSGVILAYYLTPPSDILDRFGFTSALRKAGVTGGAA